MPRLHKKSQSKFIVVSKNSVVDNIKHREQVQ